MHSVVTTVNNAVLKVAKIMDLKTSHYKNKNFIAMYGDRC